MRLKNISLFVLAAMLARQASAQTEQPYGGVVGKTLADSKNGGQSP